MHKTIMHHCIDLGIKKMVNDMAWENVGEQGTIAGLENLNFLLMFNNLL